MKKPTMPDVARDPVERPRREETVLVERAKAGDEAAFSELHRCHKRAVRGFIGPRARNDTDTDEIEQRTWIDVWTHLDDYDESVGSFRAFVLYRAWIQLARFYRQTKHGLVLVGALLNRYPDRENESEILDLIAGAASLWQDPEVEVAEQASEDERLSGCAFRATFESPIPPHQYLAFGFTTLLAWKPARVAHELGGLALQEVEARFEEECLALSALPAALVESSLVPLRESMRVRLGDVVDAYKTRKKHGALLNDVVGDTVLRAYAGASLEDDIYQWRYTAAMRATTRVRRSCRGLRPQA